MSCFLGAALSPIESDINILGLHVGGGNTVDFSGRRLSVGVASHTAIAIAGVLGGAAGAFGALLGGDWIWVALKVRTNVFKAIFDG